jgi:hypothetical protein
MPKKPRTRAHSPRVTKADLERVVALLAKLGAKVASVEVSPGKVKIITTDGAGLTLPDDEEALDREIEAFRAKNWGG